MLRTRRLLYALPLMGLSGCALLYEGKYDHDEGWRLGRVEAVHVTASTKVSRHADCRAQAAQDTSKNRDFALVSFRDNRYRHWRIARVADGAELRVGDFIYVNRQGCEATLQVPHLEAHGRPREVIVPLWR